MNGFPDFRDRIIVDEKVMGGQPVIKGTRVPIKLILHLLSQGCTIEDILEDYPFLTREDILAAQAYAADVLDHVSQ